MSVGMWCMHSHPHSAAGAVTPIKPPPPSQRVVLCLLRPVPRVCAPFLSEMERAADRLRMCRQIKQPASRWEEDKERQARRPTRRVSAAAGPATSAAAAVREAQRGHRRGESPLLWRRKPRRASGTSDSLEGRVTPQQIGPGSAPS